MALEATVICVDNSEWMRNGDFSPSRFEAQQDACVSICGTKTRQNPENSVGLIATAGRAVEVCVPLTQDLGKMVAALHKVKISGEANFVSAIRVAQLALRHRQKTSKKQEQRIVLFVGSPVTADDQELKEIGKSLKKNSIAIDIISFGEPNAQENEEKLQALLKAANSTDESGKDNSHFVPIPTGNLSDVLAQMNGDQPGSATMELDPELAWAMELSKQTFEQENKQTTSTPATGDKDVEMQTLEEPQISNQSSGLPPGLIGDFENDPEFLEAIRLSLQTEQGPPATSSTSVPAPAPATVPVPEDDDLARALKLSETTAHEDKKRDEKTTTPEPKKDKKDQQTTKPDVSRDSMDVDMSGIDPSFLESVVLDLPEVDKNDPEVQKLLQAFKKDDKDKK